MPDGQMVVMWGFAVDSAFEAKDGQIMVPGPMLTVPADQTSLTIYLDNDLPEPVSVFIPSQIATNVPVKFTDDKGRERIRSFTHETEPNNAAPVMYTWNNLRPGTYLYHSGSHVAVQVQMGLYGCLKKDAIAAEGNEPAEAYDDVPYDTEVVICYSEIDPALHMAVADGNYGPGKAMTSTMNYKPKYFLVNGQPYSEGQLPILAGAAPDRVLLRFLNAGIETHAPVIQNLYMNVVAEDGYQYKYGKLQYSLTLPAHKTKDAIIVPATAGTYPIYDRRLRLTYADAFPGGMLTYLNITSN
jgi:FtsP/CotA-like multicopper oxidase with cupredoxin domain